MFFIIADYVNKNFGNIFNFNKYKLSPIIPINDLESYYITIPCGYSTQEELDALV